MPVSSCVAGISAIHGLPIAQQRAWMNGGAPAGFGVPADHRRCDLRRGAGVLRQRPARGPAARDASAPVARKRLLSDGGFVTRRLEVPRGYGSAGRPFYLHARSHGGPPEPLVLLLHGLYQTPGEVERATGAAAYSEHRALHAGLSDRRARGVERGLVLPRRHRQRRRLPRRPRALRRHPHSRRPASRLRLGLFQRRDDGLARGLPDPRHLRRRGRDGRRAAGEVPAAGPRRRSAWPARHDRPVRAAATRTTRTRHSRTRRASARELAPGSTLDVVLLKRLGHAWPPLRGKFDALNVIWQGLRGYRVDHPATVTSPADG